MPTGLDRWLAPMLVGFLLACGSAQRRPPQAPARPAWVSLDAGLEAAAHDGRPVLLSIQADWCHWCHVMNETTYRDPEVVSMLDERFVAAREDAELRPDLAERYAEYGWPATIVFAPDGTEILALRGHRTSAALLEILGAITSDIDAGRAPGASLPSRATEPRVGEHVALEVLRAALTHQLDDLYDEAMGGWGTPQKYPFEGPVEHTLLRARLGSDPLLRERAILTLERETELLDPIWGGMYQYSEQGDWQHPHYERIASVQAGAIEGFALALRASLDRAWRARALDIVRYVRAFLMRDDGALYASQDADLRLPDGTATLGAEYATLSDADRRARGIPTVDTRVLATANGLLITALARLAEVAPELGTLADATRAADVIVRTARDARGLFRHEAGAAGDTRFLADQIAMSRALFAVEQAGGDRRYRALARDSLDAALLAFTASDAILLASRTAEDGAHGTLAVPRFPPTENALAASLLLAFARLEEDGSDEASRDESRALAILDALSDPAALAPLGRKVGEILLALEAAHSGIVRFSVVGEAADPRTIALHRAVLALDEPLRVVERSEPDEGRYPAQDGPVVYACAQDRCSFPLASAGSLGSDASRFLGR